MATTTPLLLYTWHCPECRHPISTRSDYARFLAIADHDAHTHGTGEPPTQPTKGI